MKQPEPVDALRQRIGALVSSHEAWRATTLNLIASENILSPTVAGALASDLEGRYADYPGRDPAKRRYRGNRYIAEIEAEANRIAQERFGARYTELRPIGGHLAGIAVVMGVCRPGDLVLEVGREAGGHREVGRLVSARLVSDPLTSLDVEDLPFDPARFNLDVAASIAMIEERRPRLVILGSSNFLFPHPVREIAEAVHRIPEAVVAYDASHVMGFLAAGRFQDPLREGADIVFGSTHKTLPGPQGGIIFSNDDRIMDGVTAALVPALVTNHHPARMPALALALLEMAEWGGAYADAVVSNARELAAAISNAGVPVVQVDGRVTDSHTILLRVAEWGTADQVADRLEAAGIMTTGAFLPEALGRDGIRIGSQEMTRRGATAQTMEAAGRLVAAAIRGERGAAGAAGAADIAGEVARLVGSLPGMAFTWPS